MRLDAIVVVGVVCFAGKCLPAIADEATPKRPKILLAVADDWAWPHAGVAGDKVVRTPTFDRLAREGVLFSC